MFRKAPSQLNSHAYVEERLSAYIDGQLPESERVQVRRHLQTCPQCQSSLDSLGWTVRLMKQVPAPPLPRQFTLPVPEPKAAPAPWFRWGLATASVLAAVVVVSIVTLGYLSQQGGSSQLAAPAAAPAQHTLVAAVAPTSAPPRQERAAAPTVLPSTEESVVLPAATSAPLPTELPTSNAFRVQSEPEASPTEERLPLVSKAAPSTLPCQACGGGLGGGAPDQTQTPETRMMTAPSAITDTGTVKDRTAGVRDFPSDKADQIGLLSRGNDVRVLERDSTDTWLRIIYPLANDQGLTGWVAAKSITLTVPIDNVPTEAAPTETPTPPAGMIDTTPEGAATSTEAITQSTATASATPTRMTGPAEASTAEATATATTLAGVTPTATPTHTLTETSPA